MSKARARKTIDLRLSQERMYELIRRPLVTEKTTLGGEHGQVAFQVPLDASKPEIKAAVEGLFKVKVKAVNTAVQKGKVKRFRVVSASAQTSRRLMSPLRKVTPST